MRTPRSEGDLQDKQEKIIKELEWTMGMDFHTLRFNEPQLIQVI